MSTKSDKNTNSKKKIPEKKMYQFWENNSGFYDDVEMVSENELMLEIENSISGENDSFITVAEYEFKRIRKFRAINKVEEVK